ncbi:MAG: type 4a pilus biogenesis protein PilO [Gemmatimonadaceae bacterium]|nr:type 4a pilus biogenesis protein PilO [Gemmatimonadaceae bacterium]
MAGLPPMTKREQNLVALALVVAVAVAAYWYLLWTPKNDELVLLEARVAKLDSTNAKAKKEARAGKLDDLKREVERANQSLALMRQLVPTGNEVPALLDQVSVAARSAGLEMAGVKPEAVIPGDQFDTYRYSVSMLGSYHQTVRFFADVGSLTRIMAPVGISIVPRQEQSNNRRRLGADQQLLDVDFELQTFVAKTAPVTPPAGGAK